MTPEERTRLIEKIAALPQQLEDLVCPLPPHVLMARPEPGEWSAAQNVHHLADSHINSFVRMKLILTEENPTLKPYGQELWAERPDADHAGIAESLQLLRGLHARWVRLFESLTEDEWARFGTHPEWSQPYTIEEILRIYSGHGEAHLDQILRAVAAVQSASC